MPLTAEMDKTSDTGTVNFRLSQVDTAFSSRSYDVFSCLDSIEAKHIAFEKNQFDNRSDLLKPDPIDEPVACKTKFNTDEPVACKTKFKIPKGMPRKSRLPDYSLRPDKWKSYSLLDVSHEQMSDLSNQRTALDFIESLKNRAAGSCPDATNQVDDDCMDTCTDTQVGQSCFASHKQHRFQKPAVQSLKQTKVDENQSELKPVSKMVDVGPNLWIQQTEEENEVASCEGINNNLSEDAEGSVDDTLHLSTKADSLEADSLFQNKVLKCKSKHIRPRIVAEESEEDNDSLALKNKDFQAAKHADCESAESESEESDGFSDYAVENSDEESQSGLAASEYDMNNWSDLHCEEQDNSNDGDSSVNSNSCSVSGQDDIKLQNLDKEDDCTDDLDTVD